MSQELWVAVLASVPALVVGYALGRWDEWRREGKERTAITTALSMEIATNLAELEAVWSEIHRPAEPQEHAVAQHPQVDIRPAVRLARRPPPRWRRGVWDTSLPRITAALTPEALTRVERFYQGLSHVDNRLAAIGKPWKSAAGNLRLDDSGVRAWIELKGTVADLRKGGNPLSTRPD